MSDGWGVFKMSNSEVHIAPLNDIRTHDLTTYCECNPIIDDDGVIIHNSWDFREVREEIKDGTLLKNIRTA